MTVTTLITVVRGLWRLWKESGPAAEEWIKERKKHELENVTRRGDGISVDKLPDDRPGGGVASREAEGGADKVGCGTRTLE